MRTSLSAVLLSFGLLGAALLTPGPARAGDILITNQGTKWRIAPADAVSPLAVNVKKGDVIEFRPGLGHGVVTLKDRGDQNPPPAADLQLVLVCGEKPESKPAHVLREIECPAPSRFNSQLTTSMKLEVTDKFAADVHFWCINHTSDMWGTFKLAP
jgi:hypothetical protein